MNSFSILIVSWNSMDLLNNCIQSVYYYLSNYDFEVVVVDNNSKDGSDKLLSKFEKKYSNFKLIKNLDNQGFAAGNNKAFESASHDIIVLMNPDIRLIDKGILKLVNLISLNDKMGVLYCRLYNESVSNQTIHRMLPTLENVFFRYSYFGSFFDRNILNSYFERRHKYLNKPRIEIEVIEQPAAALLVIRRRTIDKLGYLFDEDFPIYGNDVDLCKRIIDLEFTNFVDYSVKIWHKGSSSSIHLAKGKTKNMRRVWVSTYFRKHENFFKYFLSKLIMAF